MGVYDFNSMFQQAEEAGFTTTDLPVGVYEAEVAGTKVGETYKKDKDQIGVRFKVLNGPHEGQSTWLNITFPQRDGQGNPNAIPPFLRKLGWFGVDKQFLANNPGTEEIAARIASNGPKRISVTQRNGKANDGTAKVFTDVAVTGDLSDTGTPAPPVPVTGSTTGHLPPAVGDRGEASVSAPPAAAPPSAPEDSPEVAALKAQLAAAQAQAAPAPAATETAAAPAATPEGQPLPARRW